MSLTDYLKPVTREFALRDIYVQCGRLTVCRNANGQPADQRDPQFPVDLPLTTRLEGWLPSCDGTFTFKNESPPVTIILRALEVGFALGAQAGQERVAGLLAELRGMTEGSPAPPSPSGEEETRREIARAIGDLTKAVGRLDTKIGALQPLAGA